MPISTQNLLVTVMAGYREKQVRPFLASLRHFAPKTSLRIIVGRSNPEFEDAVRAWFPDCSFNLLPPSPLRDFAVKRKWARSVLKRLARWSGSQNLGRRLLKINFLRHVVIRDLLSSWKLDHANVLLCDSRDLVFQADPFSDRWPTLWTCEEDKRIEECNFNSFCLRRAGGDAAFQEVKHCRIVCAGVMGGRVDRVFQYFLQSSKIVERLTPQIPLTDGDQGIHNYLVRLRTELGFTVLPNGGFFCANIGYTPASELIVDDASVKLRGRKDIPAILHQYDRHPRLTELVNTRWANVRPPAT